MPHPRFQLAPLALAAVLALTTLAIAAPSAHAQAAAVAVPISLPAQPLGKALNELARQAKLQLMVHPDLLAGKQAPAVSGTLTPRQALDRLLAGSGLVAEINGAEVIVRQAPASPSASAETTLSSVTVTAQAERSATSEGTGSYAARAATLFKGAQLLKDIPYSVSVITRQQLDDQNIGTLEDVLRETAGISTWSNRDGQPGEIYMRGFDVAVQQDGLVGANAGSDSTALYDRVEILRGPSALLRGSGSAGGIVNFVKKRPEAEFAVRGYAALGSWQQRSADIDVTGALDEQKRIRARGVLAAKDRHFFFDRADEQNWTGYGIIEADVSPETTLGFSVVAEDRDLSPFAGLNGYTNGEPLDVPRSTNLSPDWVRSKIKTQSYALDAEHRLPGDWKIKGVLRYEDKSYKNRDVSLRSAVNPVTNLANYALSYADYDYDTLAGDIHATGSFQMFGRQHELTIGYTASRENSVGGGHWINVPGIDIFNPTAGLSVDPLLEPVTSKSATRTTQSGIYGTSRWQVAEKLKLVLGGRFSNYSTRTRSTLPSVSEWTQGAKADNEFSPYGGAIFDVTPEIALYASYADIFIPNTAKDYTEKVLDPRVGWQAEIGAKGEFFGGRLNASIATFRIREENRPEEDRDPSHVCSWVSSGTCSVASGMVKSRGWELEVNGSPLPGWQLHAGYTRLTSTSRTSYDPKHTFSLWSTYRFGVGALQGWSVGAGVRGRSSQDVGFVVGGYGVASFMLGYRVNSKWQIALNVNNVFDKVYYLQGQGVTRGYRYFGEPRNVLLALRGSF